MVGPGLQDVEECHRLTHFLSERGGGGSKMVFFEWPLWIAKTFRFDVGDFCLFTTSKQTNKADERVRGG